MTPQDNQPPRNEGLPAQWIPALILIAVGAIFFLNNLNIIRFGDIFVYWPVVLVALGIYMVADRPDGGSKVGGGILTAVGGIVLSINLGFLHMGWGELWPLIPIALGILMLSERLMGSSLGWSGRWTARAEWHDNWERGADRAYRRGWRRHGLRESAVFWGGKRVVTDPDFQGGKVDCVFGGYEIDLRGATIQDDFAVLKIDAVFGGAEITVPLAWEVDISGTGVFGAFVDQTQHPDRSVNPNPKRLVVKGSAVFGGVTIKN